MNINQENPVTEAPQELDETKPTEEVTPALPSEPPPKKTNFLLITVFALFFLIIPSLITYYFLTRENENKDVDKTEFENVEENTTEDNDTEEWDEISESEVSFLDYTNDYYPTFVFRYPSDLIVKESSSVSVNKDSISPIRQYKDAGNTYTEVDVDAIDTIVTFSNNDYSIGLGLIGFPITSVNGCYKEDEVNYVRINNGLVRSKQDNSSESYFYGSIIDAEYSPHAPWDEPGPSSCTDEYVASGVLGYIGGTETLDGQYAAMMSIGVEIFNLNKKSEILKIVDSIVTELYELEGFGSSN